MSNLAEKVMEDDESKDGASILSASQAFEEFALRYAEIHLNNTERMTITNKKLGKLLHWLAYFNCNWIMAGGFKTTV